MMIVPSKVKAEFINFVKIVEVKDIDYIIHFINIYNGKTYVFKVYKELFDKAMEVRKVSELEITVTNDKPKAKEQKEEDMAPDVAMVYM